MTDPSAPSGPPSDAASAASTSAAYRQTQEKKAALPRELADFLIELSIALHKHAMYPGGHPTLAPAAEGVARRLGSLLVQRGKLSLGVARDQLIIEGVATDPKNPVLHDLAERLHRHHLGAVSFDRGLTPEELEDALKRLAKDAERGGGEPLGLLPRAQIPRWPHLELYPLTFERLELVGGPEDAEGDASASVTGGRGALLWVGLARAALAADDKPPAPAAPPEPFAFRPDAPAAVQEAPPLGDDEIDAALAEVHVGEMEVATAEPAAVARAIEAHERGTAYDQVIVGYMLQIAEDLKQGGPGNAALQKKMSRLINNLDEHTLQRLLDMGGDHDQRRQFILDAAQGMTADAVVDLVKAASGRGAPISDAMLRMLRKLGHHAERGSAQRRALADSTLREQVTELLKGWDLADPNPDGYRYALSRMAESAPTLITATEAAYTPEAERIVQMALETGSVGVPLDRAVSDFIARGRIPELIALLDRAPKANAATDHVRSRVQDPEMLKLALDAQPVDFALVDQLVGALGPRAAAPMLDVLAESDSRTLRRALIDRLLKMPAHVGPLLASRLADERWYVKRNVLYLAAELPGEAPALEAAALRQHEDPRVRREALRVLFRLPAERDRAICTALVDDDPRVKRLALNAVVDGGAPDPAVPLLVTMASEDDNDSELRVGAIRALATKGGRMALGALLKLTEIRRRSLIDLVAGSGASPELLAAVTALGAFRGESRARERLELLAEGRDPVLAAAAVDALKEPG